jgi:hypothetical protein
MNYRRTSWDNQFKPFESKTTTAMLWRWVQINQSHLKCSPKKLATVVCALRTIVTTCTKNNHCHHSQNMRTADLRAILVKSKLFDKFCAKEEPLAEEVEGKAAEMQDS